MGLNVAGTAPEPQVLPGAMTSSLFVLAKATPVNVRMHSSPLMHTDPERSQALQAGKCQRKRCSLPEWSAERPSKERSLCWVSSAAMPKEKVSVAAAAGFAHVCCEALASKALLSVQDAPLSRISKP